MNPQRSKLRNLAGLALGALLLALASPAAGEPPPQPQPAAASPSPSESSPLIASTWCTVGSHRADSSRPGCDVGIGVSLFSWKRLSWVAVLGSKTVGVGVAWRAYSPTPQFPHVIAVALGLVSSHDSSGIDRHPYPALGATLSFGGKQPEDPQ